jgi:CDP-glucose 4,6-dehydratase
MVNRAALEKAFRGRRVLVTGDTGFKGSWLSLWLQQLGAEVRGLALPAPREDDHFKLLGLQTLIRHVDGDIRDLAVVQTQFADFKPEVVFHLAAQSLVRASYADPKQTFDTNVAGSVNILEGVRAAPSVRALVYVTSDKCYRNLEWDWGYRENDQLGGHDPYSASKAAAEVVFSSYQDSFFAARAGLGAASVRAGNVIGGGDWADNRIVPDVIRALQAGTPVTLRNPDSTRPWQHVLEPLSGYLEIAVRLLEDAKRYSGAWNFGPDPRSIRSVGDLTQLILKQWGSGRVEVAREAGAPHEARLLHLNCDKAHQLLQWWPKWDVQRAVVETVSWYRELFAGGRAHDISGRQITQYMES